MKTAMKIFGVLTLMVAVGTFVGCSKNNDDHAGHDHMAHQAAQSAKNAVEQTMCPVMDAPINKNLFVEYEGKKVYFCCPGCEAEFTSNPEKYLDKLPQFQK